MQQAQTRTVTSPILGVVVLVVGIALGIIAQFFLDSLADSSPTWHQIQHGTLFVGGIVVGVGVMLVYAVARSRS
jgi:ABC-type spermidine/putrescine transport system permease subunit II